MTARDVGLIVADRLRAERRRFELFRKGIVTAVDTSVVPHLVWVNDGSQARPMPYIDPVIAVGDVVQWVDQSDPFCWAKADGFEVEGNYTGGQITVRGKSFSSSGDGFPATGTFYDYDQGLTGPDSIILNPLNRVHPVFATTEWTGGVVLFSYGQGDAAHTTDFFKTDISGDDLTPSLHFDWDGTIVPPLPGPTVDEYLNLGGGGGVGLRTHGNVGLGDLPGFHSHAVSISRSTPNNASGAASVLRNVDSIVTKEMATAMTTVVPGTTIPWGASITAPGPDWLMMFLAHVKPHVDVVTPAPTADIWIRPNDVADTYWPAWVPFGTKTNTGKNGGIVFGYWRSWQAGTYTPKFELENVGPNREVAFSAMLCQYRVETA